MIPLLLTLGVGCAFGFVAGVFGTTARLIDQARHLDAERSQLAKDRELLSHGQVHLADDRERLDRARRELLEMQYRLDCGVEQLRQDRLRYAFEVLHAHQETARLS